MKTLLRSEGCSGPASPAPVPTVEIKLVDLGLGDIRPAPFSRALHLAIAALQHRVQALQTCRLSIDQRILLRQILDGANELEAALVARSGDEEEAPTPASLALLPVLGMLVNEARTLEGMLDAEVSDSNNHGGTEKLSAAASGAAAKKLLSLAKHLTVPVDPSSPMRPESLVKLGTAYWKGNGVAQDVVLALRYFRRASEQLHAPACMYLGTLYAAGTSVDKDYAEAERYFALGAVAGLAEAQYNLAVLHELGLGVDANPISARALYKLASDQGLAEAQFCLAELHQCCSGGDAADRHEATVWYRAAANQGHLLAQFRLGSLYLKGAGDGFPPQPHIAKEFFLKASRQGHRHAQLQLGILYELSEAKTEAARWYREATLKGYRDLYERDRFLFVPPAMVDGGVLHLPAAGTVDSASRWKQQDTKRIAQAKYRLAMCKAGRGGGVSLAAARSHLEASAFHGHGDAHNTGSQSESKPPVPDYERSLLSFQSVADQGHVADQGLRHAKGQGVPKNYYAQAAAHYRQAADLGQMQAQFNLGLLYANGQGVRQSHTQAASWYRLAAAQGMAPAQCNLGILHTRGYGVPKDYLEAAWLFRLAAEQGHAEAQRHLGALYQTGLGVEMATSCGGGGMRWCCWNRCRSPNLPQAADWYRRAAAQGDVEAFVRLRLVERVMNTPLPKPGKFRFRNVFSFLSPK